jgi:hypothetical protein
MTSKEKFLALIFALPCLLISTSGWPVKYTEPPECYTLRLGEASRTIGIQEGVLSHTCLYNRLTDKNIYIEAEEFEVWLKNDKLKASEFKVKDVKAEEEHILVTLAHPEKPLEVELHYQGKPGSFFIQKWLVLFPKDGASFFVDRIVLEKFKPWCEPRSFFGPGQPVYVGDTFFGVEYPSSQNEISEGQVFCSYLVGLTVGEQGLVSKKSVYGVSEPGKVEHRFLEYVDDIRAHPVRPFLLYNTWYDLRHFSANQVIASLKGFQEKFNDPYSIMFDSVVLDSGWDNYLDCWSPHPRRFPEGFAPVREEARNSGAQLGLWMSPLGGYVWRQWARLFGSVGKGYEKSWQGFCIAGPKYHEWFKNRMITYMRQEEVNYFKLDNLTTSCGNPKHGHRIGKYAQAGLTDAFIDILDAVRAENKEVMLNITRGAWLSPWWLMHADVVWVGGMDYFYSGKGTKRQRAINYRDQIMYKRFGEEKAQFPLNSLMTHGIIKGKKQLLGEKDARASQSSKSIKDFQDDCMMYFGRGVMMWELYLSPDTLSGQEWEFLAHTIKWARKSWPLLARSRMVLGDPALEQVYGYWHELGQDGLLFVRNPKDMPQKALLIWSEILENKNMEVQLQEVLYPGEEKLAHKLISGGIEVAMKPFQTLALEIKLKPRSATEAPEHQRIP